MKGIIKYLFIFQLLVLGVINSNFGAGINDSQAFNYASEFILKINEKFETNNLLLRNNYFNVTENDKTLAFVYNLYPQGFIIISAFETNTPVIGFSLDDDLPKGDRLKDLPVYSIIKGISYSHKYIKCDTKEAVKEKSILLEEIYGPYVYTLWGQVNCHNSQGQLINVTNYYTPNHYAAGCVAISMSTLLHYYQWPPVGEDFHEYYDGWGSSTGWYEANFGETWYKWNLMLEKYNNQVSTDLQREAAGELAFHAAVALEMNFEYNGSTSNVNDIPGCGSNYFRFYSFYKQENSTVFWPRLDKNIVEANPIILSIEGNTGFGHSVICDGLWINDDEERYYHLNMGWWGSGNGWFTIQENFNAGGYNTINGGVLDFIPKPFLHEIYIPSDTNMFHLIWEFTNTLIPDAFEIQHKINNGAWETITDDYQDTALLVVIDNILDDRSFRVRAKVNNEWYPSSWSNSEQIQFITKVNDHNIDIGLNVDPNPFESYLKISSSLTTEQVINIRVFDGSGKLFYESGKIKSFDGITIPTQSWSRGIYLVNIQLANQQKIFKVVRR